MKYAYLPFSFQLNLSRIRHFVYLQWHIKIPLIWCLLLLNFLLSCNKIIQGNKITYFESSCAENVFLKHRTNLLNNKINLPSNNTAKNDMLLRSLLLHKWPLHRQANQRMRGKARDKMMITDWWIGGRLVQCSHPFSSFPESRTCAKPKFRFLLLIFFFPQ